MLQIGCSSIHSGSTAPKVLLAVTSQLGSPPPLPPARDFHSCCAAASATFAGAAIALRSSRAARSSRCGQAHSRRGGRGFNRRRTLKRCSGLAQGPVLVEVVEMEGKGKGLRATEDIQTGDVLIQEAPLYSERGHTLTPVQSVESMKALPQENLESIQELAASEGKKLREVGFEDADLVLLRALRTNAVALPDGGQALYSISCRANHSCQPNAALHPGMDGVMRLTALRTIHAGEKSTCHT